MGNSETNMLGEWNIYEGMTECKLPAEVKVALDEAIGTVLGASYTPVLYVGSQVVAGMNYKIVCKQTLSTLGQDKDVVEMIIFKPLEGPAIKTSMVSILK